MTPQRKSEGKEELSEVNVIGYSTTDKGIGQVARTYAKILKDLKVSVSVRPIHMGGLPNLDCIGLAENSVNLVIANPNSGDIKQAMEVAGVEAFQAAYNIGSWWWELESSPPLSWQRHAFLYKEIWAGSEFIRRVLSENFSIPVKLVPPVVELTPSSKKLPDGVECDDDEFVFFFVCDFDSSTHRKNPIAIIKAFRKAFKPSEKARLIIKASNIRSHLEYWEDMVELSKDANITLLNESLSRLELDSLFHRCNCYVSLHRSEGFGLTIAEAMLAGKPVVATGWSGNMDFMNASNSYIVPYEMVAIPEGARPYRRGSRWAEPDIDAASIYMREVFDNPEKAAVKARLGARTIQEKYSKTAVAEIIENALSDARTFVTEQKLEKRELRHRSRMPHVTISDQTNVSVCLPVCNGEDYLHEAIESILDQTYSNFEFIIVDDASDDSSFNIASEFAQKDPRIRLSRNEKRLGLFQNYNECMRRATGKYIKPFAQDDILDRSMLTIAISVMERHPSISLFSSRRKFVTYKSQPNESWLAKHYLPIVAENTVTTGDAAITQCLFPIINRIGEPCVVMFPRRLAGTGFDEKLFHMGDIDFWFELLQKGTAYHSSDNLCSYRTHADSASMTNTQSLVFALDSVRIGKKLDPFFKRNGFSFDDFMAQEVPHLVGWGNRATDADRFLGELAMQRASMQVDPDAYKDLLWHVLRHANGAHATPHGERSHKEKRLLNQVRVLQHQIADLQNEVHHHQGVKVGYLTDVSERIETLEQEVKELMSSQSWKFTEALRQISRAFGRGAGNIGNNRDTRRLIDEEDFRSEEEVMHDYLLHLTNLKISIQKSRSWQLTAPLRSLGVLKTDQSMF